MIQSLLNGINSVIAFFEAHRAMDGVLAIWAVRDWKAIVAAYPFIAAKGGLFLIVKRFFYNPSPVVKPLEINVKD